MATDARLRLRHHGSLIEVTPNGQTPAAGALRYTYDQVYQLTQVERYTGGAYATQASMVYDGAGHRLSITAWQGVVGVTARYSVDDWAQGAVLTATTLGQSTYYLYGADGVFAEQTATWGYYLKDGQSTVRQMAGARGAVTLMRRYDPFGQVLEQYGSGTLAWGYFGGLVDAATGLLYLGNGLYYDPATGRLLTPAGPGPNPYVPYAPGSADPLSAMVGPLALIALVALRRRKRGKRDELVDRLLVLAAVLLVAGTGLVACTTPPGPTSMPPPTRNANTPPGTPQSGTTPTQGADPTATNTSTPMPPAPSGTPTPTITPCTPTPTGTPPLTPTAVPPAPPCTPTAEEPTCIDPTRDDERTMVGHVLLKEGGSSIGGDAMRSIAQVIRNRVGGAQFADTILGVISQNNGGAFNRRYKK